MIIGTGIDIIEVNRIEKNLSNERFLDKIYTKQEIQYIKNKKMNAQTAAGIFAAKEAVSKCLGTGISSFSWTDIEIKKSSNEKPYIALYNNAYNIANSKGIYKIHVSISHIKETAVACAVSEGISKEFKEINTIKENLFTFSNANKYIRKRENETHKGTYGRVAVIAGSIGMSGAPYLSSMAALRTGSGLVYTIVPQRLETILSIKLTEAIVKPIKDDNCGFLTKENIKDIYDIIEKCDVVVLGPGIGTNNQTVELVTNIIKDTAKPLIIDADGLNCIIECVDILKKRPGKTIITPHPGEMSRLLHKKNINSKNKVILARDFSYKYNVVTVLKGHNTVTASPDGSYFINKTGNAGMATAGSGDVLTGIIASLVGQGIDCFDAASCGVFIHGLSGDIGSCKIGEYGLIARDIIEHIPYAIKNIIQFEGLVE